MLKPISKCQFDPIVRFFNKYFLFWNMFLFIFQFSIRVSKSSIDQIPEVRSVVCTKTDNNRTLSYMFHICFFFVVCLVCGLQQSQNWNNTHTHTHTNTIIYTTWLSIDGAFYTNLPSDWTWTDGPPFSANRRDPRQCL